VKLSNSAQMREMDRYVIDALGVPSTLLMTNAAEHVAKAAMEYTVPGGSAAVFCGPGNNGGDGVAAAVYLMKHGISVRSFLVGKREKMTADTLEMERRLGELGGKLEDFGDTADAEYYVHHCDVVIDALFGIGLNTTLRGAALDAVKLMNASPARVVSADIPSGVEADTGRILGEAVHADVTVTFTLPKPGHFVEPGCVCSGVLRVADIGIPPELAESAESDSFAVFPCDITIPRRRPDTHKGDYGRDLIIAGSVGYTGAPVLASRAASKTGAGLVFLGVPEEIYHIAAVKCTEEIVFPLPCSAGRLSADATAYILERLERSDVCLVGPGLGRSDALLDIVNAIIQKSRIPLILDADGINAVSGNIDILDEAECPIVLTPHAGEFARLGGDLSCDGRFAGNRLRAAKSFAEDHGCILVLKGHRTITAFPDGSAYINTTGGPGMAKGGAGDVLGGMIASLLGQKFPIKDAVLAAVCLHGLSGDMCAARIGEYSVLAGDLIDEIPAAMASVTGHEKYVMK
jgi:hydroxyethylthiazole kinase-like uncharacterized protein yjeF